MTKEEQVLLLIHDDDGNLSVKTVSSQEEARKSGEGETSTSQLETSIVEDVIIINNNYISNENDNQLLQAALHQPQERESLHLKSIRQLTTISVPKQPRKRPLEESTLQQQQQQQAQQLSTEEMWTLFKASRQLGDVKIAQMAEHWLEELSGADINYSNFFVVPSRMVKVAICFQATSLTLLAGYRFVEAILEKLSGRSNNNNNINNTNNNANKPNWTFEEGCQLTPGTSGPKPIDICLGTFLCQAGHFHLLEEIITKVLHRCTTVATVAKLYKNTLAPWPGALIAGSSTEATACHSRHSMGHFGLVEQYGCLVGTGADTGSLGVASSSSSSDISLKALATSGESLQVWITKVGKSVSLCATFLLMLFLSFTSSDSSPDGHVQAN